MSRPETLALAALLAGATILAGCGGPATALPTPSPTGLARPGAQVTPATIASGPATAISPAGGDATPASPAGSLATPARQRVVTLNDDNATLELASGETFLLMLGTGLDWSVTVDDQAVLARVVGVTVILGAQGIYRAGQPGTTTLRATGDPPCRRSTPPCGLPSRLFQLQVRVR